MNRIIIEVLYIAILIVRSLYGTSLDPTVGSSPVQAEGSGTVVSQSVQAEVEPTAKPKNEYAIGETWTVDGQWELTVTGVHETAARNEYEEWQPGAVYIIDYSYKNIGYEDQNGIMDGLFLSLEDTIIDSTGVMGRSYSGDIQNYPQEAPVGATCKAQSCIGVENAGDFKIIVTEYDGNGVKQSATFSIMVG